MNEKYPLALPEGSVLAGQYIIEKVLGQGGFGITYEAKDHKTGERVAVKEFFPDSMATRINQTTVSAFSGERGESFAYGKTCFLQEAETLAKFIGNENIVRIHSYFEENETAYFVMDFIEGTSFDQYLKERGGKIPFEEAEQILVPIMDALSAVHSQGIVHRDVTPDNIYITKEGVVKLLDFGAARYSLGDKSRSLDVILKHGFAPKEQYTRRGRQGPYTDVYALGATFYFALTGKRPPDSVERMDEDDLVPPSSLGVQISGAAEDAILQALGVQPGDRFQSMMAFKNALYQSQQPAAVASQPASQIYFSAPEQTNIPHSSTIPHSGTIPRSGAVGGPAPGTGQGSDLQDLASTMKTAGVLAGRLAGKMAGKVAEKTAQTAGAVAGTMAAQKGRPAGKKTLWAVEKLPKFCFILGAITLAIAIIYPIYDGPLYGFFYSSLYRSDLYWTIRENLVRLLDILILLTPILFLASLAAALIAKKRYGISIKKAVKKSIFGLIMMVSAFPVNIILYEILL